MENLQQRRIKTKTGVVVSNKMDKTATVSVDRLLLEQRFKKYVKHSKKFLVHDAKNECEMGDLVQIKETRPISKRKTWAIVKVLKRAEGKGIELKEGVATLDKGTPPPKREKTDEEATTIEEESK